jgi:hypothetical protein
VSAPATTPAAARHIIAVTPTDTVAVWPRFSSASVFCAFTRASSSSRRLLVVARRSCASLLKYLTVS